MQTTTTDGYVPYNANATRFMVSTVLPREMNGGVTGVGHDKVLHLSCAHSQLEHLAAVLEGLAARTRFQAEAAENLRAIEEPGHGVARPIIWRQHFNSYSTPADDSDTSGGIILPTLPPYTLFGIVNEAVRPMQPTSDVELSALGYEEELDAVLGSAW